RPSPGWIRRRARPARPEGARCALPLSRARDQPRADADRRRAQMTLRRPVWVLHVFVVGLALHNLAMAELWKAGVRGASLTVVAAWKEARRAAAAAGRAARRGLARARVRRADRALRADPAERPRRRGDAQGGALRAAARPRAGRRVLPRPRARADRARSPSPRADDRRDRCGRGGVRPRRRVRDPALVVAPVGRRRLVRASARLRLPG